MVTPLELLWTGKCSVFIKEKITDPTTKRTSFTDKLLHEDISCKLSFDQLKTTTPSSGAAEVTQVTKLFITNTITIPLGSKIVVTQNGVTQSYEMSGKPGIFTNHQEIMLNLFKGWA